MSAQARSIKDKAAYYAAKTKREAENDRKKLSKTKTKHGEVFEQVQRDFPLMDITVDPHFRTASLAPIGGVFVRMQILEAVSKVMVC